MDNFERRVLEKLNEAELAGVPQPVLMLPSYDSQPARAIYQERHGHVLRRRRHGHKDGHGETMDIWFPDDAANTLRLHAGVGGRGAANLLESPPPNVSCWFVSLEREQLRICGLKDGQIVISGSAFYSQLFGPVCDECHGKPGPTRIARRLDNGRKVSVESKTPLRAALIVTLVEIVSNRRIPVISHQAKEIGLPITDADLVFILREFFSREPGIVADAIRAMRLAKVTEVQWLFSTIEGFPELYCIFGNVLSNEASDQDKS